MIYLDSAATSLMKPSSVERAVVYSIRNLASPGRGGHKPSLDAAGKVFECREAAAQLFNMDDSAGVIFTSNATHGLNIAINSLVSEESRVLISGYEHNSVTRPLRAKNAKIDIAGTKLFDKDAALAEFEKKISKADVVVCTHVSNVFGFILPVYEIGELCRKANVPYIVDASQSAGVMEVDAKRLGADFVAMPGHKGLMGPQGTGILLCAGGGKPIMHGGSGSDSLSQSMPEYLPDRLEAGTQNVCGISGLLEGINFVSEKGCKNILNHERKLLEIMAEMLEKEDVELFMGDSDAQSGVLSFISKKINCEVLAQQLGEQGVCVRAGLHCAPLAHRSAGTIDSGTVRLSFSPFLTEMQVKHAAEIIKEIIKNA